jgi:hypothetical protein
MGHNNSMSRAIVFGPKELGGYGVQHIYTEMQGMKIKSILCHLGSQTLLGKAILININYLQLTSGLKSPVLKTNYPFVYIENNWLLQLREYLATISARLELSKVWKMLPQREYDMSIMDTRLQYTEARTTNSKQLEIL